MPFILLEVAYYDDEHRALIAKQTDVRTEIETIVADGIKIDAEEFFMNAVFKHQMNSDGFRTRNDLKKHVRSLRGSMLPKYFDLESGTIRSNFIGQNNTDKDSTETCGIGASLSIINRIYGLNEADWEKIDISGRKDFDFRTKASDGKRFILVESKGRIVDDLDKLDGISSAKKDIIDKKTARRTSNSRDVYIGVIAAFSTLSDRPAKCRLVDPLIESVPIDPLKYKLLARLTHYHRELTMLTKAHFLIALANRIQAISLTDDYKQFNGVVLIDRHGEQFKVPASVFESRSVVQSFSAIGEVILLGNGEFYFYGFVNEVLALLINQKHDEISSFSASAAGTFVFSYVIARVDTTELDEARIEWEALPKVPNSRRRELIMSGVLTITSGGHVLGVVKAES